MIEKRNIFISLIFLSIFWVYLWGHCANPFQVSCYSYAGWGDHLQHYWGWISYAKEKNIDLFSRSFSGWTWPISSEILYTDSIPFLSIIFKPIVSLIRKDFQYFSIASLVNLIATYFCGLLIGNYFKLRTALSSLLGILLALSPIALIRIIGHESLSLHFFVVYPITLLIVRSVNKWKWNFLIFASLGTHAYFFPIILLLRISSFIYQFRTSSLTIYKLLISLFINIFITSSFIIFGLFYFGYLGNTFTSITSDPLWSANLLALLDPGGFSLLFNKLEIIQPYQWEGYSYLGLLFFILLSISITLRITNKNNYSIIFPDKSFYIFILGLFFFIALGSPIYIGKTLLIDKSILMLEGSFMNTFRATGRFMWPIYYSLIIWSYITIATRINFNVKLKNIFIISVIFLMSENHFFVLRYVRNEMNTHYLSGINYQREIYNNKIAKLFKDNQYFINATGRPFYLSPNIPPLMPQVVNNNIKTNYHPRLARRDSEFADFYSQESCQILNNILEQSDDNLTFNSLFLMKNDSIDKCINYKFDKKLALPNENISIFSIKRQ